MLYIIPLVIMYLISESLFLLIPFFHFPQLQSPTSGNHKSDLFFWVGLFLKNSWPIVTLSVHVTQHRGSIFLYVSNMRTTVHPLAIYHHTKLLRSYWLYTPHCISYLTRLFYNWSLYLLLSPSYFFHPSFPSSLVTTCSFSISVTV